MPVSFLRDCWVLTGSTASGKTEVGIELALRLNAEIVSLDSMAIYRGMDVGTAKPTPEQRAAVPHHLVDVVEPHEDFSLARYLDAAGQAVAEIAARRRTALFVGGTPLYLKGLLRGIFEGPPADWGLRHRWMAEAQSQPPSFLHERLARVDPRAAARLHPNDTRRLIRALEVYELCGRPISELQQQFEAGRPADEYRVFVLDWPREELGRRIDRRVEVMFAAGLVEEVRHLLARPNPLNSTARLAVGYREVVEHLQGQHDLPTTMELVRRHTRQMAKRQGTWFRSLSECRFISMTGAVEPAHVAARIVDSAGCV